MLFISLLLRQLLSIFECKYFDEGSLFVNFRNVLFFFRNAARDMIGSFKGTYKRINLTMVEEYDVLGCRFHQPLNRHCWVEAQSQ